MAHLRQPEVEIPRLRGGGPAAGPLRAKRVEEPSNVVIVFVTVSVRAGGGRLARGDREDRTLRTRATHVTCCSAGGNPTVPMAGQNCSGSGSGPAPHSS